MKLCHLFAGVSYGHVSAPFPENRFPLNVLFAAGP